MIAKKIYATSALNREDMLKCQTHDIRRDLRFENEDRGNVFKKIWDCVEMSSQDQCATLWITLLFINYSFVYKRHNVVYWIQNVAFISFPHVLSIFLFSKETNIYEKTKPNNLFLSHTAGALQATFDLLVCCTMWERDLKKKRGNRREQHSVSNS